jgi:hypothetical protein
MKNLVAFATRPESGLGARASRIAVTVPLRKDLETKGYSFVEGKGFVLDAKLQKAVDGLCASYDQLPVDPYSSGKRYRRLSRFVLLPFAEVLEPRPTSEYFQAANLNPVDGGMVRHFERLAPEVEGSKFLRELIWFDFLSSPFTDSTWNQPIDVGVHAIRMFAKPGEPGVSSPDCLHKDGEPVTFIHLMARRDVLGGESLVADNAKVPLFKTTLMNCLDTIAVWDEAVYHHVQQIEVVPGKEKGFRDVLLVDFTPMIAPTVQHALAA